MCYMSRAQLEKIIRETNYYEIIIMNNYTNYYKIIIIIIRSYTTHCYMKTTAHRTPHPPTHTYSVHDIYTI